MFKKNRQNNEEERCCAVCVYAKTGEGCFCVKKRKETAENAVCASFEYDLLKRSPAPFRPLETPDELSEGAL